MKITSLMINNFIGIKLLKVDKFGKLNFIEGGNGVGKSSIVKAIGEAFQSSGVKPEIIHAGEDKSEIFIKLSDGTEIQRNITATTNTVKVTQDGKTLTRPQTFLNDLFGPNVFNPVAFFNGAPAQRRAMILTAIDAKMEPDDLVFEGENYLAESGILKAVNFKENGLIVAAAIKQIVYDKRTEVGRDVTRMTKAIEQDKKELPESFDAAKWGGFNFKEKQAELANAQSNVAAYEAAKLALKQKRDEFDRAEKEIEDIQTQIAKLHDRIESLTQRQEILDREGMDIKAQIDAFTLPNIDTMTKDLDEYMKDQRLAARIESMTQRGTELETARVEHEKLDRLHEHLVKEVPARIMEIGRASCRERV